MAGRQWFLLEDIEARPGDLAGPQRRDQVVEAPVGELERDAGLVIEGDRALALRYASLFSLPDKLT